MCDTFPAWVCMKSLSINLFQMGSLGIRRPIISIIVEQSCPTLGSINGFSIGSLPNTTTSLVAQEVEHVSTNPTAVGYIPEPQLSCSWLVFAIVECVCHCECKWVNEKQCKAL
ncbi:hypothetical protein EXN66_Car011949 [Channa argus]|uniref:Uncharacterized protein n=1 Tax=Channa argus TaxID=215402 RepID=A0A6G1Q192_CHAAH|nr:hypothetical protein EXN66_Car011949 [Channa argus]